MTARGAKRILVLAGPNGAGKTTFAREYLPADAGFPAFVNADLIADELSPGRPEAAAVAAARLMLERIDACVRSGESFAIETTLAGRGYARAIPRWRAAGYRARLLFLRLASVDLALARVARRVAEGGHDVPEAVVRRRFAAGGANLTSIYRARVDEWAVYDNSGASPVLVERGGLGAEADDGVREPSDTLADEVSPALTRAAHRARERALAHGGFVVVRRDGRVVHDPVVSPRLPHAD